VQSASAQTNAIIDPGFESGLSGWSCPSNASAVTGHAHTGTYALAGAASASDTAQGTQNISVSPNTTYTLSAYVNGSYVFLGVSGAVSASNWTPGTGGSYQPLSVTFSTGSATTVTVFVHGWYGTGTYYADDFSLPVASGNPSPTNTSASPVPSSPA